MYDIFGFNPKSFSEDELADRLTELNKRITWASRVGYYDAAQQFLQQKLLLEQEQRERLMAPRWAAIQPGVIVESDPELAAQHRQRLEAEEAIKSPPKPKPRQKFTREQRTSRPSSDDQG